MAKKNSKNNSEHWQDSVQRTFQSHVAAFKTSFRNLAITPLTTLMTILTIGICLSFPMSLYLFIKNVQHFSQGWDPGSAITLYVNAKITPDETNTIVNKIQEYPFVNKTSVLSAQEALEEFQKASGLNDALALLPENPLPGVISIQLNPGQGSEAQLQAMKEKLSSLPQVKQVDFDYAWVDKLKSFLSFGKTFSQFLYLIIGCGVILMVGNTIRMALGRHRNEIEVLTLIGATQAFIRRPFLYRGILYGVFAGIIALLITALSIYCLQPKAQHLISLYQGLFSLETFQIYDTVGFLTASAVLGWLGAVIAFMQQKRAIANDPNTF